MRTVRVNFPWNVELPQRYEVVRWIADGGMASVWCVEDQVLGRRVAIKLLADGFAENDRAIRRFMREARTAARLSGHPHVVSIHDIGQARITGGEDRRRPFIVMDYLAGGTVAEAVRSKEVDRETLIRWLSEAAAALDFAHAGGVVHRDVKPGNLLLDREQLLYVADFGIARLGSEDTITQADQVLGTAAYLSPEQALGRPATDASDRYSLAIVAYELLVGERPFAAQPAAAQARQHVEEEPPRASRRNPALPRAVDAVLARGMAKRPEERFESATAFVSALEQATIRAHRPRFERRTFTTTHRRGAVLAALAAAAFVVGVAAGADNHGAPRAHASTAAAHRAARRHSAHRTSAKHKHHAQPAPAQTATATPAAQTTSTAPPGAAALEAQGHQLMLDGNYAAAIPVLRQAVAAADPSSPTYAYALFDLGRSLRLAGDPRAAVQVLYQRLQIPDQTGIVRYELQLALQALGQQAAPSGGASPAGPPGHGKHGKGPDGNGPPGHGGQGA